MATTRDSTTVRIGRQTHARLKSIAAQTGEQLADVLERAVDHEERRRFWERFRAGVARLKADPQAWAAYQAEQRELEGTLGDGLVDEDWRELLRARPDEIEFLEADDAAAR